MAKRFALYRGETTVTVKGKGKGGRNTELVLVFALEVKGMITLHSCQLGLMVQTGPTDAAGALEEMGDHSEAKLFNLDPEACL